MRFCFENDISRPVSHQASLGAVPGARFLAEVRSCGGCVSATWHNAECL